MDLKEIANQATQVIKFVANELQIDPKLIITKTRKAHIVRARELVVFILKENGHKFEDIALSLSYGNHSSAFSAYRRAASQATPATLLKKFNYQHQINA